MKRFKEERRETPVRNNKRWQETRNQVAKHNAKNIDKIFFLQVKFRDQDGKIKIKETDQQKNDHIIAHGIRVKYIMK